MNLETAIGGRIAGAERALRDLTHCPSFTLGPICVEPARRVLNGADGRTVVIQPLAMRVLVALADAGEETCSRDDLMARCWGQRFVGDDALHRVISTLRRDLARAGGGAVTIDTVAKVGYRLRQATSANDQTTDPGRSRSALFGGAAALAIAAIAAGAALIPRSPAGAVSIAVVPEQVGPKHDTAAFAAALVPELSRLAAAMPLLTFFDGGAAPPDNSLALKVSLEATPGGQTAHAALIDHRGALVWSRDFAPDGGGLQRLRDEVAYGVAGVVQCGFERSAAVFHDPVSLRLYLGACDAVEARDWPRARAFAQQIVELRPDAAGSWACLAMTTIHAAEEGPSDPEVIERATRYAERALKLDPHSGLAWQALAMSREAQGKPVLAILEKGMESDPDHTGLQMRYAWALIRTGHVRESVEPALRSLALQPHDPGLHAAATAAMMIAGQIDRAREINREMQKLWPDVGNVAVQSAQLLAYAPNARAGLAALDALRFPDGFSPDLLREFLVWRTDPARYRWERFDQIAREQFGADPAQAWSLAFAAARMYDRERAFAWLVRAPSSADAPWARLLGPDMADLQRDPRFFAKMRAVGLVDVWTRSRDWPDFCALKGLRYSCPAP